MLEKLKEIVCRENKALLENGLVRWTSGNLSARDPETNLVVIKPSGVMFAELTPDRMMVIDLDGNVVEGNEKPSVDSKSHLYVYRHRTDVNGVVHTHSPFATSFAIRGEPLKVYTTTAAGVFGSTIPISDFVTIGEEEIGREIVEKIGKAEAILIRNHGVFTIGRDSTSALKNAVVLEENAEYVYYALLRNKDIKPLDDSVVEFNYKNYHTCYGQKK